MRRILITTALIAFALTLLSCTLNTGNTHKDITAEEFGSMLEKKDFFLVDVHIPEQEHLQGTDAFIPFDNISNNLDKLPKDKSAKIVVYCRSGSMSLKASKELAEMGYTNVFNLLGGKRAFDALQEE